MIVGCYVLHLYCEDCARLGDFTGRSERDAHDAARNAGWIVRPALNKALCRVHARTPLDRVGDVPPPTMPA